MLDKVSLNGIIGAIPTTHIGEKTMAKTVAIGYQIIDNQTQLVRGTYKSASTARRKADKLDNEYGAVRYVVKTIWGERGETVETAEN